MKNLKTSEQIIEGLIKNEHEEYELDKNFSNEEYILFDNKIFIEASDGVLCMHINSEVDITHIMTYDIIYPDSAILITNKEHDQKRKDTIDKLSLLLNMLK